MKNLVHNKLKEAHNKYFSRLFGDNFSGNHDNFGNILTKHKDSHGISTLTNDACMDKLFQTL